MFERTKRGFALTRASLRVLWLDKELLWLPVMSAATLIVALLLVAAGLVGTGAATVVAMDAADVAVSEDAAGPLVDAAIYGAMFLFYLTVAFVVVFFNVALVECASIRFDGGDPTLRDGLRKAWQRKGRILQWAAVAATVGMVLRLLGERARGLGKFLFWGAELAWAAATFFVAPILAHADVGPVDAIRRSVEAVRRAWGESLVGGFSTALLFILAGVGWVLFSIFVLLKATVAMGLPFWVFPVVFVAPLILLVVANAAAEGVLRAGLYWYAETGVVPSGFEGAAEWLPAPEGDGLA